MGENNDKEKEIKKREERRFISRDQCNNIFIIATRRTIGENKDKEKEIRKREETRFISRDTIDGEGQIFREATAGAAVAVAVGWSRRHHSNVFRKGSKLCAPLTSFSLAPILLSPPLPLTHSPRLPPSSHPHTLSSPPFPSWSTSSLLDSLVSFLFFLLFILYFRSLLSLFSTSF